MAHAAAGDLDHNLARAGLARLEPSRLKGAWAAVMSQRWAERVIRCLRIAVCAWATPWRVARQAWPPRTILTPATDARTLLPPFATTEMNRAARAPPLSRSVYRSSWHRLRYVAAHTRTDLARSGRVHSDKGIIVLLYLYQSVP